MSYVHGYSDRETQRLLEQSLILEDLLHEGTRFPSGSRVLEVGCGVGAQTSILARRNPGIHLTSIDISEVSVEKAGGLVSELGLKNVTVKQADLFDLGFEKAAFDHIFICFVLEHLKEPTKALRKTKELLAKGGTLTVIEGDHGSGFWTPESIPSRLSWRGLIDSQLNLGHDPNIGRKLYPLLIEAGFEPEYVEPRPVYADRSDPVLLDGVVNKIIVPMVSSAEQQVLEEKLVDQANWEQGLKDLSAVSSHMEGSFFYTWFKGLATPNS
jgi:SAM-dependent methyltransferase